MSDLDKRDVEVKDTTSNADNAPGGVDDLFGDEFFDSLEKSLEPVLTADDEGPTFTDMVESPRDKEEKKGSEEDLRKELETLKKRYSDSSREAKRLKEELDQVKSLLPLLQSIKEKGSASEGITDFFQQSGKAQKNLKEELGLPEDFVFDPEEAINNPNSDSAKVLNALVESRVTEKLNAFREEQERMARMMAEEQEIKRKFNLTDEQFKEIMNWAKTRPFRMEDIVFLYAKEHGLFERNAQKSAREDMLRQMRNVRTKPSSAASVPSQSDERNVEDEIFKLIKREVDGFEEFIE